VRGRRFARLLDAPFTIVNLVAGASLIGMRDFMLGTLIGMRPAEWFIYGRTLRRPVSHFYRARSPRTSPTRYRLFAWTASGCIRVSILYAGTYIEVRSVWWHRITIR
jgi:hypothetical protein